MIKYPTNNELKRAILETNGLSITNESNLALMVKDEIAEILNKPSLLVFNKKRALTKLIVNDKPEYDYLELSVFLNGIPQILLMNIKGIFLVSNQNDIKKLEKRNIVFNPQVAFQNEQNFIVINVLKVESDVEQSILSNQQTDVDYEKEVKVEVWHSVFMALYSSLVENPLFFDEVDSSPEAATALFENLVYGPVEEVEKEANFAE